MKNIEKILLYLIFFGCTQAHGMEEAAIKAASATGKTVFEKAVEGLDAAGPYVGLAVQSYKIGQEIRRHNYPTEEEKGRANDIAEVYAFVIAEKEFRRCMAQNRVAQRNISGRPQACEEIASLFSMLGGKNEVNQLTAIYNQYKNDQNPF